MRTIVFLLRTDSVTGQREGEFYEAEKGIIHCNVWSSPKLVDHEVIIATGEAAIKEVFGRCEDFWPVNGNALAHLKESEQ